MRAPIDSAGSSHGFRSELPLILLGAPMDSVGSSYVIGVLCGSSHCKRAGGGSSHSIFWEHGSSHLLFLGAPTEIVWELPWLILGAPMDSAGSSHGFRWELPWLGGGNSQGVLGYTQLYVLGCTQQARWELPLKTNGSTHTYSKHVGWAVRQYSIEGPTSDSSLTVKQTVPVLCRDKTPILAGTC
ncbi:hypothetical protein C8R45DRAFT_926903 [Mycena sanguinolenta]|nr:hypothetical protein C8R45DRAFT_926903 [Mycena sanguinolenta]